MISQSDIDAYQRDGAIVIRQIFNDYIPHITDGITLNMTNPGPYASDNGLPLDGTHGRFFDDYCNWTRLPPFERVIRRSPAAEIAARVMQSSMAQFFHDHVLVKEPQTTKETPWHQDAPYYFVDGWDTVSFWIPVDRVERESSLRFIAGSHRDETYIKPVRWADDSDFYIDNNHDSNNSSSLSFRDCPTTEDIMTNNNTNNDHKILSWDLDPGDAVLFHFRTIHGAPGHLSQSQRRRALSLRWVGDDARYVERPGKTSPPYEGHGMTEGQRLREDWFPVIYRRDKEEKEK